MTENIEFYIGDTYSRDITILKYTKPITDMFFTVKINDNYKSFVLQKTLNNGITIVDEGTNEDGDYYRTYNLNIDATDTDNLKPDTDYTYDFEIISPGTSFASIKQTIITGIFRITNDTTKTFNEN